MLSQAVRTYSRKIITRYDSISKTNLHITKVGFLLAFLLVSLRPCAGETKVLFQTDSVTGGLFPSDRLTTPDPSTRTGLRMDLPPSENFCDADTYASVCSNAALLNQLDGFSLHSRVMVCFSDDVQPTTLTDGIKLIPLDSPQKVISINQVLYHSDSKSHCAYARPDSVLDQGSRYLLLVTNAVMDKNGQPVRDDGSFKRSLLKGDPYDSALAAALNSFSSPLPLSGSIVAASLFTTMNATSWLQDVHDYVRRDALSLVLPAGFPYQFQISDLQSLVWQADTGTGTESQPIPLSVLSKVGHVESVAFGLFMSPNYLNTIGSAAGTITTEGTKPVPIPGLLGGLTFGYVPVSFHVFLPSGPMPSKGWPVVIYGHGLGDNQFGAPTYIASTLAANGYATLAFEVTGHGYGLDSKIAVTDKYSRKFTVVAPGRGVQIAANAPIGPSDGCVAPGAVAIRDCARQTAVDLFALVKTIQQTHGLTLGLDPQRIYYVGQSFGSVYGSLFHAVEPNVRAAVLSVGGGSNVDVARLSLPGRQLVDYYLAGLGIPSNTPPFEDYFHDYGDFHENYNDEYVFRDQSVVTDAVPGALPVQAALEAADWIGMLGDPLAFAPHWKTAPFPGMPEKSTLFHYSLGDLEEPNPANSALIRAGGIEGSSWFLRTDIAAQSAPEIPFIMSPGVPFPILPHRMLSNPTIFDDPNETSISLAEQQSVAEYFNSDGQTIPDPNLYLTGIFQGVTLFEQLAKLPEELNFFIPK